jgi:hypothetical protein
MYSPKFSVKLLYSNVEKSQGVSLYARRLVITSPVRNTKADRCSDWSSDIRHAPHKQLRDRLLGQDEHDDAVSALVAPPAVD